VERRAAARDRIGTPWPPVGWKLTIGGFLVGTARHPSLVAKMAETLDRLSGGRLVLALGGGAPINEQAFRALGLGHGSAREVVRPTEETIDVIRGLWGQSDFSYAGEHFTTTAADLQPKPLRRLPIWLDAAYRGLSVVRSAAARAGRDPDELTCGYNIAVMVQEGAAPRARSLVAASRWPASWPASWPRSSAAASRS
jgi:alkanesulfonate monooxygenase SsuD/methylene tetrahydromethanopterin reductase-like flavin-dependent oxidoreductase (luciferase family)